MKTLIKLKQQALDQQRKHLVALQDAQERLLAAEQKLKQALAHEAKLAEKNTDLARYFGGFAMGNEKQQAENRAQQAQLQEQINAQQDIISEAFRELKTYEIAHENAQAAEKARLDKRESDEMDEIGLRKHQE